MKRRTPIILVEAAEDLEAGRDFYEAIEPGVGSYFSHSLLATIDSLRLYAGIHSKRFGYFRVLAQRFPFAVYYDIAEDDVYIVAVLDMRQNPETIRSILLSRSKD